MARSEYRPVAPEHDREAQHAARAHSGLTQEEVAASMGTTKSAVSRLEGAGKHSPSVSTLKKYAKAVGCDIEIRLVPAPRRTSASSGRRER